MKGFLSKIKGFSIAEYKQIETFLINKNVSIRAWIKYKKNFYWIKILSWDLTIRLKIGSFYIRKVSNILGFLRRGLILLLYLLIWRCVLLPSINYSLTDLSGYLFTIGAMVGGILAITFTISIFAQQRSSDLYSSKFFNVYAHNIVEKTTYFSLIFITVSFFFIGSNYEQFTKIIGDNFLINFSVFLVLLAVVLVDWQYEDVRIKSDPTKAIGFLEKQAKKLLKDSHSKAVRMAKIMAFNIPGLTIEQAIPRTYQIIDPYIKKVTEYILSIYEISNKLFDRGELISGKSGLMGVVRIVSAFFNNRKDTLVSKGSLISPLASQPDIQGFLTPVLENLNNTGEKFIREQNNEKSSYIVTIYYELVKSAKDLTFINSRNENLVLDQIKGYLGFYSDYAIRNKNDEVILQAIATFKLIGNIAVEKNLELTYYGIHEDLRKTAYYGLTEKKTFLADNAFIAWHEFIRNSFIRNSYTGSHQLDKPINEIKNLSLNFFLFDQAGLFNKGQTIFSLTRGYDEYFETLRIIFYNFGELKKEDKDSQKQSIINLLDEFNISTRRLADEMKNADSFIVETISRLIFSINCNLLDLTYDSDFQDQRTKSEIENLFHWYIHILPSFSYNAVNIEDNNNFNSLMEAVAKTGLYVASRKEYKPELIKECISAVWSVCKSAITKMKDSYGYTNPRLMMRLCYIGIIALKKEDKANFNTVKKHIKEFEIEYRIKFAELTSEDRLNTELTLWRSSFASDKLNLLSLRDDAQAMTYELVNEADIDRFMFEIWHEYSDDSPIKDELEDKLNKMKNELNVIINKPIEEVFAFTIKPENTPKWINSIDKEETNEWPIKDGTIYKNVNKDGVWTKYRVFSVKENESFGLKREDGIYFVVYKYKKLGENQTELTYGEWVTDGILEDPFTQDILDDLKIVMEGGKI